MSAPEYCTTQQAANLLGTSVTYVQQLVEAGALEAWKTRGGHRRIPLAAVHTYRKRLSEAAGAAQPQIPANADAVIASPAESGAPASALSLMIIEDLPMQSVLYKRQLEAWNLPIAATYCESGYPRVGRRFNPRACSSSKGIVRAAPSPAKTHSKPRTPSSPARRYRP